MRPLNPDKLLHTKWTATRPHDGEKHFMVIQVGGKTCHRHRPVTLQAVTTGQTCTLDWRDLTNTKDWYSGWQRIDDESSSAHGLDTAPNRCINPIEHDLTQAVAFSGVSKSYDIGGGSPLRLLIS